MRAFRLILCLIACAAPLSARAQPVEAVAEALGSVVRIEPAWSQGGDDSGLTRGLGSGFVLDAAGHVATNAHVVGEAPTVILVSPDGGRRAGRVVGRDALTDIALIAPAGGAFAPPLAAGDGEALRSGERVYAIGSPIAFPFSVTEGIVSGLGRAYDPAWPVDFIQHDAAINPGSSGGPLIDAEGRVVGMNTATPAETLFDIGIGLAIPIELVAEVADALVREGGLSRGGLGLVVRGADAGILTTLGVDARQGLLIDEVTPGSAAEAAGIRSGDVILTAAGSPLRYPRDLSAVLMALSRGEQLHLEVATGAQVRPLSVELGRPDATAPLRGRLAQDALSTRDRRRDGAGLRFASVESGEGVLINEVADGSLAADYGVRRGDLLLAVDGRPVASAAAADAALSGDRELAVLRLLRPGRGVRHLALPLTAEAAERRPPGLPTDLGSGPL